MAPQEFEVNSVRKRSLSDRHDHITHIGNNLDRWMMTAEGVMTRIESCGDAFYIVDRKIGKRAYVAVVRGDGSRPPYLRTRINGDWRDDLLAQRRCDEGCQLIG
jgi:predicted metalloprotease